MEEAWLRGPIPGVHPLLAPVLFSFRQAREDLERWTAGLTPAQINARASHSASVAFHVRHIAGSTDRLMTYLQGQALSAEQMAVLRSEETVDAGGREELLENLDRAFRHAEMVVRGLDPAGLAEARTVGRKQLPTTVIGLLTHIAEHTQRHVGLAIAAARLASSR